MATMAIASMETLPDSIILEILKYLTMKELCLSSRVCTRWGRIARDNSLWKHVDLSMYRLDASKMWMVIRSYFSECLHTLKLCGDLNEIRDKNPLSDAILGDLNERCPNIKDISLRTCLLHDINMKLPVSLTCIELNHCSWRPRWFENAHKLLPNLKQLSLVLTRGVDNYDLDDISKITSLQVLNLNGCYRIGEKGLYMIATKLINLKTLEISYCECTDLILHHITRHLPKLEVLNLRDSCNITDSGISTLVSGLDHIKHLNIKSCQSLTTASVECLLIVRSLKSLVCDPSHITAQLQKVLETNGCYVTLLDTTGPKLRHCFCQACNVGMSDRMSIATTGSNRRITNVGNRGCMRVQSTGAMGIRRRIPR